MFNGINILFKNTVGRRAIDNFIDRRVIYFYCFEFINYSGVYNNGSIIYRR